MKNYFIKTDSIKLLNEKINEIIKINNFNENGIYRFPLEKIEDIDLISKEFFLDSIFNEKKIFIIREPFFLKEKEKIKKLDLFFKKINLIKTDNLILFYTFDKKSNLKYDELKKFENIKINSPINRDLKKYIINFLNENKIKFNLKIPDEIIRRSNKNFDIISYELEKIKILNIKELNLDFIKKNQYDVKGENIFLLTSSIIEKNYKKINQIIDNLKSQSFSPILILELIVNELALILQIKFTNENFKKGNLKNNELGLNSFRLMNIELNAKKINLNEIKNVFYDLFELLTKFKTKKITNEYEIIKNKIFCLI